VDVMQNTGSQDSYSDTIQKLADYPAHVFEYATHDFTLLIEMHPKAPTFGEQELFSTMEEMGIGQYRQLLRDIYNVSSDSIGQINNEVRRTYVPSSDYFYEIPGRRYKGADGKERKTLPKFIPIHIHAQLESLLLTSTTVINAKKPASDPTRPGLIIDSAYRSPWYQAIVIARNIHKYGIPGAFTYVTLPGYSQHSDEKHTAVDFTVIGDAQGLITSDPLTGKPNNVLGFEHSLEFEYLLQNAPNHGFWLPYHPNPSDPQSNTTALGIVFEPWHWQYVGENATSLMKKHLVYESVLARKKQRI